MSNYCEDIKKKLIFKGEYFTNTDDAVHVDDEYTQKMIDGVVEGLMNSKDGADFKFSATGDTIVFGFKYLEDGDIDIFVAQDYHQACIYTEDKGKSWDAVNWANERKETMEKKEEIFRCPVCQGKGIVPNGFYNPSGYAISSTSSRETCRSCQGKGVIWR